MENAHIARVFDELADLLELAGESPFKLRAYRNFAELARETGDSLQEIAVKNELEKLDGVGPAIAKKVVDLLNKGTFEALEKARAAIPPTLPELLKVPGLGAKTVRKLHLDANIVSLADLAAACEDGRIAGLAGFGTKKQEKIAAAVKTLLEGKKSILLAQARAAADVVAEWLGAAGIASPRAAAHAARDRDASAVDVVLVGPAGRGAEVVDDVHLLVRGLSRADVLVKLGAHAQSDADGESAKTQIAVANLEAVESDRVDVKIEGAEVHLRVVAASEWIHACLVEGSDEAHAAWLTALAGGADGLLSICRNAKSDKEVYEKLGATRVPSELREGAAPQVPSDLIDGALGGVFHVHSDWSDGTATIADMLRAAKAAGLGFVGLSDHSKAAWYANGLDGSRLADQVAEVAAARKEVPEVALFHGIEVDILPDGSLDLDDDVLMHLDFVIASVHSQLAMDADAMTKRLVRAVSHPLVTILGHPTGRLLLARKGNAFDVREVARAAAANGTCLEINANPQRLDLSDTMVRAAKEEGARFAIDPDAHGTRGFDDTILGVIVARRAALSTGDVLNAQSAKEVGEVLARRKSAALKKMDRSV